VQGHTGRDLEIVFVQINPVGMELANRRGDVFGVVAALSTL